MGVAWGGWGGVGGVEVLELHDETGPACPLLLALLRTRGWRAGACARRRRPGSGTTSGHCGTCSLHARGHGRSWAERLLGRQVVCGCGWWGVSFSLLSAVSCLAAFKWPLA